MIPTQPTDMTKIVVKITQGIFQTNNWLNVDVINELWPKILLPNCDKNLGTQPQEINILFWPIFLYFTYPPRDQPLLHLFNWLYADVKGKVAGDSGLLLCWTPSK